MGSVVVIFYGLTPGGFFGLSGIFSPAGVPEGMGLLFGSLAELMPEEQTTLAGVLRLWVILFAFGGFVLMVVWMIGAGAPGP